MGNVGIVFRHVKRSGRYFRVADPDWEDPLEGSYSSLKGARWNPPGSFPVVYLNRSIELAGKFVEAKFRRLPFSISDLRDDRRPVLIPAKIPRSQYADIVTDEGVRSAGLPVTYPVDAQGVLIPHSDCQPIGQLAWETGENGIACRSATENATPDEEELAYFRESGTLRAESAIKFDDWYQ